MGYCEAFLEIWICAGEGECVDERDGRKVPEDVREACLPVEEPERRGAVGGVDGGDGFDRRAVSEEQRNRGEVLKRDYSGEVSR